MQLVIVESPTKAKKISQYLGKDFTVKASLGHVRDLPKSQLGVDVENDFLPTYDVPVKSKKVISELKSLAKKASHIYLASDPDREGEAIAWHILEAWQDTALTKKSQRAVFHEITSEAVKKAISQPKKINQDLVDAQQARRVLDRLVGYKLSPLLWKKVRRGLSAGRVQSVALRLIVEREKEIEAFVPEEFWEVDVLVETPEKAPLTARVYQLNGETYEPTKEEHVAPLRTWIPDSQIKVAAIEKKKRTRKPYAPFTTSTLQQAASTRLGMSAKQAMILAQQLYEEGYITYHRTDSTALSTQALDMARSYIQKEFGQDSLPAKANTYATKSKNAQEAHEAIRPTVPQAVLPHEGKMTASHGRLYDLIFRRFIASQMTDAVYDQTTIFLDLTKDKHAAQARTAGSVIVHAGWLQVIPGGEETILPAVTEGEVLEFRDLFTAQKFTQPPARYNDASLVKELEKRGIGRPSTYASIISVILDRGYVDRQSKAFVATSVGRTVIEFLLENFADIIDYDFTANLEDDLDEIALGNKQWQKVMKTFFGPFSQKLGKVEETAQRKAVPVQPLDKPCPTCGVSAQAFAQLVENKKNLGSLTAAEREGIVLREQPNGELVIREGRFGKFISCSRYPECEYTEKYLEKIDMVCPQCGEGDVVAKKSKKGRTFFGCSRYPECDFASWKKPGESSE